MKRPLLELLAERTIAHPSVITAVTIAAARLEMRIDGVAWWDGSTADGQIRFIFEYPQDGCLDLVQFGMALDDEMLEDFSIGPVADTAWAFEPEVHVTYCRGPLPEPLMLFQRLHDALIAAGAPWGAFAYLNGGPTLARFRGLTKNDDYMLAEAPAAIHAIIVDELARQHVDFTVLAHPRVPSGALGVRLNGRSFVCRDAFAEW